MSRVPFSGVDALMQALDEPARPQTIELEVGLAQRLDERRLREAVATAAARHPMARARRVPPKPLDLNFVWEIENECRGDPVEVCTASDSPDVDDARNAFYSRHIDLADGPPFRVLLVHGADGDRVMLSVNHGAFDGVASLRLLQSISRAYAGEDDALPDVDPLKTRGVLDHPMAGADHRGGSASPRTARPTRLAPATPSGSSGFGILHVDLTFADVTPPGQATINDALMAAVHLSVDRWNRGHGAACGDVSVMMPVSQRPSAWRGEVVANLVLTGRVVSSVEDRAEPHQLLASICAQTQRIKSEGVGDTSQLDRTGRAPVVLRHLLPRVIDAVAGHFADTTVLSNLGRVDDPPWFGGHGIGIWFSPPPRSPVILALGAAAADDRLGISIRWCQSALSCADARDFADIFVAALPTLLTAA